MLVLTAVVLQVHEAPAGLQQLHDMEGLIMIHSSHLQIHLHIAGLTSPEHFCLLSAFAPGRCTVCYTRKYVMTAGYAMMLFETVHKCKAL